MNDKLAFILTTNINQTHAVKSIIKRNRTLVGIIHDRLKSRLGISAATFASIILRSDKGPKARTWLDRRRHAFDRRI
jgi:hypothetical protein